MTHILAMTTRNLNRTWRDVIFAQYAADYDANVPFPVSYLIKAVQWNRDIIITVPSKIDLQTYRRSVRNFFLTKRGADPVYRDEHISVKPRVSPLRDQSQEGNGDHERQDQAAVQDDAVWVDTDDARDSA